MAHYAYSSMTSTCNFTQNMVGEGEDNSSDEVGASRKQYCSIRQQIQQYILTAISPKNSLRLPMKSDRGCLQFQSLELF